MADVPHLSPDEFRRRGHELIDFITDYWRSLQSEQAPPVSSPCKPGDILRALPEQAPLHGEPWSQVMADVRSIIMPGITHWQHPAFFAYFPANSSGPGVLGELLSAGLGVNGMLWATSPAATELETRVLDWIARAVALPERFLSTAPNPPGGGGVIQSTASESTLVAMLAARQRARAADPADRREPVVYCSAQAHSSVVKAAMIAGIADGPGDDLHARRIETDASCAMIPDALETHIRRDLAEARRPLYICATAGTTSSMAFDDLGAVSAIARRHGLWMHVDAAMAGAAAICPEFRPLFAGIEAADSLCFNPHKWMLTTFDCDLFYAADRAALLGALSITPEYLRTVPGDKGQVIDYRDWQIPLGRRFRALKLWFVLRHYGIEGLQEHIRRSCRHAELAESLLREDDRIEIAAPRSLCLVCFRLRAAPGESTAAADRRTKALCERINASGKILLTHTTIPDPASGASRSTIRLSAGGTFTQDRHIRGAVALIRSLIDAPA